MADYNVLIPYNFSSHDEKALEFALKTFSHLPDVKLSLYHCYTAAPDIEIKEHLVTGKLKGNLAYISQKIMEHESMLTAVCNRCIQKGLSEKKITCVYRPRKKDVASEIIEIVEKENFHMVVLNRRPARITRFFTGSISLKVVSALTNRIVCIIS